MNECRYLNSRINIFVESITSRLLKQNLKGKDLLDEIPASSFVLASLSHSDTL